MKKTLSSKSIALGGILAALTVLSVFLANVMPTNTFSFFVISSVFVSIILLEMGVKTAWTFYLATTFLSLILAPDKTMVIPFATFFGVYGIIKYHIEKLRKIVVEYILKLIFFNLNVVLAYFLVNAIFQTKAISDKIPVWILFLALQFIFVIYDYIYTLFINYYINRLKKLLKI